MDRKRGVTVATLKIIAYLSMFVDHFFASYYELYFESPRYGRVVDSLSDDIIYNTGRDIGRIAFFIFAFLIVQGIGHSHNRLRYVVRLFVFALISEWPFDFGLFGSNMDWEYQNVGFTLFFGAIAIWAIDYFGRRIYFSAPICIACMAVNYFIKADYGFAGVALIVAIYIFRDKFANMVAFASLIFFFALGIDWLLGWYKEYTEYFATFSDWIFYIRQALVGAARSECFGMLAFIPIYYYHGEPGRRFPRIIYYTLYPAHLIILGILCKIVF